MSPFLHFNADQEKAPNSPACADHVRFSTLIKIYLTEIVSGFCLCLSSGNTNYNRVTCFFLRHGHVFVQFKFAHPGYISDLIICRILVCYCYLILEGLFIEWMTQQICCEPHLIRLYQSVNYKYYCLPYIDH